jgi:NAD(P)-dependent dehydrogenase (short-subunit alcohol dehydrogenase family)
MTSRPRVLVTGGSMGIGRAVAEELASHGAQLVLVARGIDPLEEARHALPGEGHEVHALDVADEQAWSALAPRLERLDGLVNAAGVLGPIGPIGSYEPVEFRRTIEINLLGTLLAVHHCLPALRAARGAVVTFSGGGATGPLPRYDAYAASKAAVVRLTENLAPELARDGIRINAVAPGFVATRIHEATLAAGPESAGPDYFARTERDLAGGGVPPSEAAELVRLLLDAESAAFSGKLLSAQWDPWRDPDFRARLVAEPDLATLRRIDDVLFAALPAGSEAS